MSNQQQWFVRVANGERGPFTGAQLKAFAAGGKLTPQMQIRRGDITEWFPAGKVTGLFTASGPSATNQRATSADTSPGTGAKLLARPLSPAMVVPTAPSATALAILACSLITSGVVSSLIISFVFRGD
jgi:GYF domain 2